MGDEKSADASTSRVYFAAGTDERQISLEVDGSADEVALAMRTPDFAKLKHRGERVYVNPRLVTHIRATRKSTLQPVAGGETIVGNIRERPF